MYRCSICPTVSEPGQRRLVHRLYRPDKNIAAEFGVCPACKRDLDWGITVERLVKEKGGPVTVDKTPHKPTHTTTPPVSVAPPSEPEPLPSPPEPAHRVLLGGRQQRTGPFVPR